MRIDDFASKSLIQDSHSLWDKLFEETGIKLNPHMNQFNQTALAMDAAANGYNVLYPNDRRSSPEIQAVVAWIFSEVAGGAAESED